MIRLSFIGSVLLSLLHRWWRPATIQCRHLRRMEAHGHPERAAWGRQPVRLVTAIPFCRPPTTIECKAREHILRIRYFHLLDPLLLLLFGLDTSSGDSVNELLEGGIAYFTEYNTYHRTPPQDASGFRHGEECGVPCSERGQKGIRSVAI